MPIPGTCPSCGAKFDLAHALTDVDARHALAQALSLPASLAKLIIPYLSLHAPAGKAVTMSKLARLLRTLQQLIDSGEITRKNETFNAPQMLWHQGLEEVLAAHDASSLLLPLKDHGYLSEIVWRKAAKSRNKQALATRVLHPSHKIFNENAPAPSGPHNTQKAELNSLQKLYDLAPNDLLKSQLQQLKQKQEAK